MTYLKCSFAAVAAFTLALSALPAHAAVSAEAAAQLNGPTLTAFGAEKAGNAEGTIPAYTGTGPKTPPGWKPGDESRYPQRPNPYDDKPLFTITAENAAQYADKLDGMTEIFKRFPNFRMDIYPTHRDYRMPQYVSENTIKNATACKAVENELKLDGCYGGLPFPIPKSGNQVMWNHLAGYQGHSVKGRAEAWIVPTGSSAVLVDRVEYVYNWPGFAPDKQEVLSSDSMYFRYIGVDEAPARLAGGKFMILDPFDQAGMGRRAYLYVTGRRWVKIAANLAYDTPSPYGGGVSTMDESAVFMGAQDRYDFRLLGKKEKFIYYNNYDFNNSASCSTEKMTSTKGFPNPDCVRWELHRVWVVEATLKPGVSHVYHKRKFYWDEDGFIAGMAENYDKDGKLFRFAHAGSYPYFEREGAHGLMITFQDIDSGTWVITGLQTCDKCGNFIVTKPLPSDTFDPNAMSGSGIR